MKLIRLLTVILATLVFNHMQAAPPRIVNDTIHSAVLARPMAYTVLLPRSFHADTTRTYPVLYLLHGLSDNNECWTAKGALQLVYDRLVASGEIGEMVIVTPTAGGRPSNVIQNGYFNIPGYKYEEYFFNELMPQFEKKYRVKADRGHRAIAGLSMGGGGATSYAQRHPDMFTSVYAMSALMGIPDSGALSKPDNTSKMGMLTQSVIDNDCTRYVAESDKDQRRALKTLRWFVDCGDDDFLLDRNLEFYKAMRKASIPCQLRVRDGSHDWEYWHTALYTALPFAWRNYTR